MSSRHLPAGQSLQGGGGGMPGTDINGGAGGRPRRRQPQHTSQYHQHGQHSQHMNPMYQHYVPYASQQYYGMPPQHYQNGVIPSPGYMTYQNYSRSPSMHQYAPMVGVSVSPNYYRPAAPQSPSLPTPYQLPPAPVPVPPETPSSTHSSQILPPPTPTTPQTSEQFLVFAPQSVENSPAEPRARFRPPLPWYSRPDLEFPTRSRFKKRRKPPSPEPRAISSSVEQQDVQEQKSETTVTNLAQTISSIEISEDPVVQETSSTEPALSSHQPTLSPATSKSSLATDVTPAASVATTASGVTAVRPSAPAISALPKHVPKPSTFEKLPQEVQQPGHDDIVSSVPTTTTATSDGGEAKKNAADAVPAAKPVPTRAPPTSWANLFAKPTMKVPVAGPSDGEAVNGDASAAPIGTGNAIGSFSKTNANGLWEAVRAYRVEGSNKISFLEPRGLINTGNMCYMNSVLQVLIFCTPFYDFLDQASKRVAHSFVSETPLIDSMIMFMREYRVLKSAPSAQQLIHSLRSEELERYGEPFTPEFVYEAIRQLPRFSNMRRGHQQDAEEFLGFLLQSLDDECTQILNASSRGLTDNEASETSNPSASSSDWLEVGRKQRPVVTRASGHSSSTPITMIFGGLLRSEFRVPGLKDSITTERYQPLQLDIGSPDVNNVVDALRGLTRPERLQGDFNSPRGKEVMATKQVLIESLPPVLILHLKRFQFDSEGRGTVKIWKQIGYPLNLEIPREVLSRQSRQSIGEGSLPQYQLISVVYHHGKNASGGHYTVDVRRQDGQEWIRLDDTVIRRVRSEDVAEVGSTPDAKDSQKAGVSSASTNRMYALNDDDAGDDDGWKRVTPASGKKAWSSVVNGSSNGIAKEKHTKDSVKDNKVAYLLFYQRI